jgi:murein L,D-transpeptidase YcbB/YkuD
LLKLRAHGYDAKTIDRTLHSFYRERSFAPNWIEHNVPSSRAEQLRQIILAANLDGLTPEDYFIGPLNARWDRRDVTSRAELDILLTLACGRFAADAREGRIEPHDIDLKLFGAERPERPDLKKIIGEVLNRSDIAVALREQFPNHRQYERMRSALADYQRITAAGGWTTIDQGPPLTLGASGKRVAALVRRLEITADMPGTKAPVDTYSDEVADAVRRFQQRHGIPVSGRVDARTLTALNVPVTERIKAIVINLERWRWLQRDFSDGKEVLVNIAGYELFAENSGDMALRLPVIVGKAHHATPVFSDRIRWVEVNPYWNVPSSIAANEMLPKQKKDPNYLAKQHMRLYDARAGSQRQLSPTSINWHKVTRAQMRRYAIKQDPGAWNALGKLKFVFPNSYSVYLHDTSAPELFARPERLFSHGCIRVSSPGRLAAFLLDSPNEPWTVDRVTEYIASGKNQVIKLPAPVRVHLTYRTAWVDRDGTVQFRPDVYGRDAKIASVMFRTKSN